VIAGPLTCYTNVPGPDRQPTRAVSPSFWAGRLARGHPWPGHLRCGLATLRRGAARL